MAKRVVLEQAVRDKAVIEVSGTILDSQLKKDFVSITEATKLLGIAHSQYVRRMVVGSKFDSIKVQMEHYAKWFVAKASIVAYMTNHRRTSTDRRYILRTALSNESAIRKALSDAGIEYSLELNYQGGNGKK